MRPIGQMIGDRGQPDDDSWDAVETLMLWRGRSDWPKIGIFAQRGKGRPNRLGVSVCRYCPWTD